MPKTDAQRRAQAAYLRKQGSIHIFCAPEEAAAVKAAAAAAGQSVKAYCLDAIRARMMQEGAQAAPEDATPI